MSYNSKYTGQRVEELLDQVANGNAGGGGGITTETDPIFSASPAAKITDENISSWNNKVDKVDGKQLSTEDFTTLLKQKLDGLSNYDDTEISQAVSKLRTDLDTLVSGDTTTAIKTFNEVIAFLDGISDTEDLSSIIASIEQQIAAKGTVTSVTAGNGLTGGSIIESGTISMPSVTTAGTKGSSNSIQLTPSNPNGSATNASGKVIGSITVDEFGRVIDIKECSINLRTVYPKEVTTSYSGLMTASDKSKLNQCITSSAASNTYATKTSLGNKQDKLVSGTSIKTINGESILGSGNITIEGGSGGGSSSGGSGAYAEVNHGTGDTTFALTPNTFHVWEEVASLDLSFAEETAGVANEYLFRFTSGATPTTLSLPDGLQWANGNEISISANKTYEISITEGLGVWVEFNTL